MLGAWSIEKVSSEVTTFPFQLVSLVIMILDSMILLLFLDIPIPFWALSVGPRPVVIAMQILFIAQPKSKIVAFPFLPSSVLCKKCLLKRYVLTNCTLHSSSVV